MLFSEASLPPATTAGTGGPTGGETTTAGSGGPTGGESTTAGTGGATGGESTTAGTGGPTGGESTTASSGGPTGGETTTAGTGGATGGESTTAGTGGPTGGETTVIPNSVCTAIETGDFNDAATWQDGQIPSGVCSIVIPAGKTVTFTGTVFDIPVPSITIHGSFIFSSTSDITIEVVIIIIIEDGGSLQDQTADNKWNLLSGSTCTFYPGSSFTGSNTVLTQFTKESGNIVFGNTTSFGSSFSGPFTFAITLTGEVQTFTKVTFIAGVSGGFNAGGTWLGGIVPTADFCASIGGCGLYISSGCELDTAELGGELNINFNDISIASGGTFVLGTSGSSGGFRFLFNCQFNIFGNLNFASSSGGLYLPWGSAFNFFGGARIISIIEVIVRTYDITIGGEGTVVSSFTSSFTGSFYGYISVEGSVVETSEAATAIPIDTSICTAIADGSFSDAATWQDGRIPSAVCSTIIPAGFTVTFSEQVFVFATSKITIEGTLSFTSASFLVFQQIINIVVAAGGSFKDETSQHKIFFLAGSLLTLSTGASFTGSGTTASQYTLDGTIIVPGSGSPLDDNIEGPFTCAALLSGEIQTFTKVTFIVGASGGFTLGATWFGGIVPTADFCSSVGGCGLYVSSGCNLDTSALNGELDINFSEISVPSGATCSLGTSGSSVGFRFKHQCNFNIYGTLSFLSSAGGIYLAWGTKFSLFAGAKFGSSFSVEIRTYDPSTGGLGSLLTSLSASFSGSYIATISVSGEATETTGGNMNCFIFIFLNNFLFLGSGTGSPAETTTAATIDTSICTAIADGSFTDAATWQDGRIPSDVCSTIIPAGFTVTFSDQAFALGTPQITIEGTLSFTSASFLVFTNIINIVVAAGGSFKEETSGHQILFTTGSFFTLSAGASFTGTNTIAMQYPGGSGTITPSDQYTIGSSVSGPFTLVTLLTGKIQTFTAVTCVAGSSGDFLSAAVWLGGVIPTADFCDAIGGCSLHIPDGVSVTTAGLDGELNINFKNIEILSGGSFGFDSMTFKFKYPLRFDLHGELAINSLGVSFYLPWGSALNLFSGCSFSNGVGALIFSYDGESTTTSAAVNVFTFLFSGEYFASISLTGTVTETNEGKIFSFL